MSSHSFRPNCQNCPRTGGIRRGITTDPGHVLISADFSGIELRVATTLSGDTNLLRMIPDGIDLHWVIARQVFGPTATKADRYTIKPGVYGRLYGGGVRTLAGQMGVDEGVAQAMIDTLDRVTPSNLRRPRRGQRSHGQRFLFVVPARVSRTLPGMLNHHSSTRSARSPRQPSRPCSTKW